MNKFLFAILKKDHSGFFNKTNYLLFLMPVLILLAYFIVWEQLYFFLFVSVVLFLVIISWKTEESLIFLLFYLPFQIALNVTSDIDLASSRVIILFLFLIWIAKSLAKKHLLIPKSSVTSLLIIFLFLAVVSSFFSINQAKSAIRLLFFFSIFPLYFVSAAYLLSVEKIFRIFYVFLISASIAGIMGIVQFISQFFYGIDAIIVFWTKYIAYLFYGQSFGKLILANPSWLVNIGGETFFRAISFFPDPHMFSFYLGMIAPIALCFAVFSDIFKFSLRKKLLLYISNAIIFLALGLTFSRAGYVGAFFGIILVVFLSWKFFNKNVKLAIAAVFLTVSIVLFSSSSAIITRFISSFNPSEGSNAQRLMNWSQSIKIIEKSPYYGVGVGNYAEAVNARSLSRSSVTAHNTYLDIASEMGVSALLVWLLMIFVAINNLCDVLKFNKNEITKEKVLAIGFIASLVWFSVQMFFDTAIYSPTLLAILMVFLAISVNLKKFQTVTK